MPRSMGDFMTTSSRIIFVGLVALALALAPQPARAQNVSYSIYVGGVSLYCRSYFGEPVAIMVDHAADGSIGVASRSFNGQPYMVLGPGYLNRVPALAAQFWFLHECAHHALPPNMNNEPNADCFAVRNLRDLGLVWDLYQLQGMLQSIYVLPGSHSHLPGPARAQHIYNCLNS